MRALTLHQPWASLIFSGRKRIETRSWGTQYRGELAIHAGKVRDRISSTEAGYFDDTGATLRFNDRFTDPLGAVLGVVELKDCICMTLEFCNRQSAQELGWGNFQPGRWAWILGWTLQFRQPIPARGARMLWDWQPPEDFSIGLRSSAVSGGAR